MSQSDEQVRLEISQLLYNRASDNPSSLGIDRAIIQATLQIPQQQMDDAVIFLEANGLITVSKADWNNWTFAKITGDGLDVIENKERFADKYAFMQNAISQIQEIGQQKFSKKEPNANFPELAANYFKQASDQVLGSSRSNNDKSKIEKQLREFQKELTRAQKADLGSIQKDWEWLKKNAGFVCPVIAPAVLETIKLILDLK
jgi:hypothetical protein